MKNKTQKEIAGIRDIKPRSSLYKKKSKAKSYVLRALLLTFTLILMLVIGIFGAVFVVAHGPSVTFRDVLVQSAMQASATKWVPGLFLPQETIDAIMASSSDVTKETISFGDYQSNYVDGSLSGDDDKDETTKDKYTFEHNGMELIYLQKPTFAAYVLLVKDPSRIYVGTSSDFTDPEVSGVDIFQIAKKEGCIAAINGGGFSDPGGVGTGNLPLGITYSKGSCVYNEETSKTFIGFDSQNKLVVLDRLSFADGEALGIRDGVCFQTGTENVLISNDGDQVTLHKVANNTATSQRTAIGQMVDGTVIFLVTDGRTTTSPGATYNDVIDIMVQFGAVTAGMLDGGSSSMLYYQNYFEVYTDIDVNALDKYQKKGLVNKYKAFTPPRDIPTYFCVKP